MGNPTWAWRLDRTAASVDDEMRAHLFPGETAELVALLREHGLQTETMRRRKMTLPDARIAGRSGYWSIQGYRATSRFSSAPELE